MKFLNLFFFFAVLAVLAFQNCSNSYQPSFDSFVSKLESGGESYDGKRQFDRNIPGYTCDNVSSPHSSLDFLEGKAFLTRNVNGQCGQRSEVPTNQILHSPNTPDYVGYESGIYANSEFAQTEREKQIFVEVWCRDLNSPTQRDFIIKWDEINRYMMGRAFDRELWPVEPSPWITGQRTIGMDTISYRGHIGERRFELVVNKSLPYPGSPWELKGTVETSYFSATGGWQIYDVACRIGGEFDREEASFRYSVSNTTLLVGQAAPALVPQINKQVIQYSTNPLLPPGLVIDQKTGVISGTPTELSPTRVYKIEAQVPFGVVSTSIYIGIGREFRVSTDLDSSDVLVGDGRCANSQHQCSLRAAFEETGGSVSIPTVVRVPAGVYKLTRGELKLQGDLSLIGEMQPTVDAQNLSRHIQVLDKSILRIQNMKWINGRSPGNGGSIQLNFSILQIEKSIFADNSTNSDSADGGAIYISRGYVTLKDSEFRNNSTRQVAGLQGGAIAVFDGYSIQISDSRFLNNSSAMGGALHVENTIYYYVSQGLKIERSEFSGNQALSGGALSVEGALNVIDNSIFKGNRAESLGSAVRGYQFQSLWIKNSEFISNLGPDAIHVSEMVNSYGNYEAIFRLYDSKLSENATISAGAASVLRQVRTSSHLKGNTFLRNQMSSCLKDSPEGSISDLGSNSFDREPCSFQ